MRPILVLFAFLALTATALAGDPVPATINQGPGVTNDVLQCMANCIRTEGSDYKDTCKMRCANVSTFGAPARRRC